MNEHKGLVGTITTLAGSIVSWLPIINQVVQLVAGLVAIAVGIATFHYYHQKNKRKSIKDYVDKETSI